MKDKLLLLALIVVGLSWGSPAFAAARFWVGGTGTWDSSTTTHWASVTNGSGGASVPVAGDTVTFDANSGGGTVTANYNFTVTSIAMGAFTGTLDLTGLTVSMATFDANGAGVRTLTITNAIINLTGTGTVWNNVATSETLNASGSTINITDASSTQKTFTGANAPLVYGAINFSGAGTGAYTFSGTATYTNVSISNSGGGNTFTMSTNAKVLGSLDLTGFAGTFTGSGTFSITTGNLTIGIALTSWTHTGTITFSATSGIQTITPNGKSISSPLILSGVGGTILLAGALTSTSTISHTGGTLNLAGFTLTSTTLTSTGTGVRALTMGGATATITGNATTVASATGSNITFTDRPSYECTYAGASGTRTITMSFAFTASNAPDIRISAGTDAVSVSAFYRNLDFTGYTTGTATLAAATVYGSLTLGAGMHTTGTAVLTFAGTSGVQTITSNGVSFSNAFTFNGAGGTFSLADDFAAAQAVTLTNGTFNMNDHNASFGHFITATGVKTLAMGNQTLTLTDATATIWNNAQNTNFTMTGTGTIKITDTSGTTLTFAGGNNTKYGTLWWSRGASIGSNTLTGSNTFLILKDTGTVQHSDIFTSNTTQHITNWQISGTAPSNFIIISIALAANFTFIKDGGGVVNADYLIISHSIATPANTWYAGTHSEDVQSAGPAGSGWIFTAPPNPNVLIKQGKTVIRGGRTIFRKSQ